MNDPSKFSDKKLLYLAKYYGEQALMWRRKFIGLLPEVNRRRLFEKKGFSSIFEFGKRMAGLSEDQIRLALNLERRFEDKPVLREALVEGRISINKLARVVSIATMENEEFLAETTKVLSNRSLEVFVKDVRLSRDFENDREDLHLTLSNQDGLFEPLIEPKSLHVHINAKFELSGEVIEKLNELQSKGLDANKILLEMFEKREKELAENKVKVAINENVKEEKRRANGKIGSRRLSVGVKKVLEDEFGDRCSVRGCMRAAKHVHHKVPFSILNSNDPHLLAPLCREHHDIAHSINTKYLGKKMGR